jgi:uncharacterized membrane protein
MSQGHLSDEPIRRPKEDPLAHSRNPNLADVVERNIRTLTEIRHQFERNRSVQDRIADTLTAYSGSMMFVYLHAIWFVCWVVINLGWVGIKPFDPFPFGLLTMIVSLEAIFLSTFVLVSQNRIGAVSDRRADLDLHMGLLAEYEITRVLTLVDAIADHLGLAVGQDAELDELKKNVAPELVLKELREREQQQKRSAAGDQKANR